MDGRAAIGDAAPMRSRALALVACAALALGACGDDDDPPATAGAQPALERAEAIEDAVAAWADAPTLDEAQRHAEDARNLITGPAVQGAGDIDGDGSAEPVDEGLLPGDDGSAGLATGLPGRCVELDVLGGAWDEPAERWDDVLRRIDAWTPQNNPFPELPSHAQRVVGWATLTVRADDLADAREYSSHAASHAALVTRALRDPDADPCPGGG